MKHTHRPLRVTVGAVLFCASLARAGVGESAVITLVFPHSARANAMGELGVALADGPDAMYWNPAGLGVHNPAWEGGAGSWFFERLLPMFDIPDLWHTAVMSTYRPRWQGEDLGAFGFDCNYVNMGANDFYSDLGDIIGTVRSREWVASLGWGMPLGGSNRHFAGLTAKAGVSALAPGIAGEGTGTAKVLAFDAGYLWTSQHKMRVGVTLNNMGPAVFYLDRSSDDALPFTVRLAFGYKDTAYIGSWPVADFSAESMLERDFAHLDASGDPDPFYKALFSDLLGDSTTAKQAFGECQYHCGGEVTLLGTFMFRSGVLFDWAGERYEWHWGLGLRLLNHLACDFSYIHSPEGLWRERLQRIDPAKTGSTGARHGQWSVTLTAFRLGRWSKNDLAPFGIDKIPGAWPPARQ